MSKILWTVGRGAMVGAVFGAVMAGIYLADGPESPAGPGPGAMFLAPTLLGAALLLLGRLPRWSLVALTGPNAALALSMDLILASVPISALASVPISAEGQMGGIFVLAGTIGYGAATWAVSTTAGWMTRIAVAAAFMVVVALAFGPGSPWWD
ncbi:hypothetical protein AB0L53_04740 [Nonomuraea sp. NPDC052129]|uniref:hypothetical protein n=1 Tax=Nonomuraea sp. NPDC052129 TaxID=3154651 RepID=UPI00341D2C10